MSVCSSAKAFLTKKKEMPVRGNAGKNDALIALIFTVFTTAIAKQRVQAQGSLDFRETQYFTFELWQKNTEYHLPLRLHLPFSPHFFYRGDSKLAPAVCGSSQHEAAGECRLIGSIPTSVSSSGPLPSTPILPARLSLAALGENPVILHRPKTITGAAAVSPPPPPCHSPSNSLRLVCPSKSRLQGNRTAAFNDANINFLLFQPCRVSHQCAH